MTDRTIRRDSAGCDQCEALMINGVYCHETGCPNIKPQDHCDQCGDPLPTKHYTDAHGEFKFCREYCAEEWQHHYEKAIKNNA